MHNHPLTHSPMRACTQTGTTSLSDLQVTTSSEALLSGKAPTFRLLVWAVDEQGEPVTNVTYVVSENFVVGRSTRSNAVRILRTESGIPAPCAWRGAHASCLMCAALVVSTVSLYAVSTFC